MHFTQVFTAALAIPAFAMAAAVPLAPRQEINRSCGGFSFLSVGKLTVRGNTERNGGAILQIKPEGAGSDSWQTKMVIPAKSEAMTFDVAGNTGVKHLRVCKSDGSKCHYPVNRDASMRWDFKVGGDRWAFAIDVIDGSDAEIQGVCGVSTEKVTVVPVAAPPATKTTPTSSPPTATETPISRTTSSSIRTTTTGNNRSTTTTSRPTATTTTRSNRNN